MEDRARARSGLPLPPILLVFKEPDFGTTLIYAAAVGASFFACVPWKHLAAPRGHGGDHRSLRRSGSCPQRGSTCWSRTRWTGSIGFLEPDVDPSGTTYNVNQSITAVGSGGSTGAASAARRQTNLNYLPEHKTDFVFSALAEQRGFLGASVLLLLYALIAWRGIKVVAVARNLFSATVAGAIVSCSSSRCS